jgi:hypothetical protein
MRAGIRQEMREETRELQQVLSQGQKAAVF